MLVRRNEIELSEVVSKTRRDVWGTSIRYTVSIASIKMRDGRRCVCHNVDVNWNCRVFSIKSFVSLFVARLRSCFYCYFCSTRPPASILSRGRKIGGKEKHCWKKKKRIYRWVKHCRAVIMSHYLQSCYFFFLRGNLFGGKAFICSRGQHPVTNWVLIRALTVKTLICDAIFILLQISCFFGGFFCQRKPTCSRFTLFQVFIITWTLGWRHQNIIRVLRLCGGENK